MHELRRRAGDIPVGSMVKMLYDEDGIEIDPGRLNEDETKWIDDDGVTLLVEETTLLDTEHGDYDHSYRESNNVYTLQDMMELMPELYPTDTMGARILSTIEYPDSDETYVPNLYWMGGQWHCAYIGVDSSESMVDFSDDTPLMAAYLTLCWLGESGFLTR